MQITIVGGGKLGESVARQLQAEGHEITVVDKEEDVISQLSNTLDVIGYVGNGASYSVLRSAGVESSDLLIALAETDEVNMLACLAAHKLGVEHTIARVRDPEYDDHLYVLREDLGLSMTVNPEKAAAEEIARILRLPSATHVELFAGGRVELISIRLPSGNILCDGLKLSEFSQKLDVTALICAVERNGEIVIPGGDFVPLAGDLLYLAGSPKEIEAVLKRIGLLAHRVENVIIAGGGRVSYYLAEELLRKGVKVKIVERDVEVAEELAEKLPRAVILQGDAADYELLSEEGLNRTDAFVALTGLDEGNILSAIYAGKHNVPKVIAKINNESLASLVKDESLETIVSPKVVTGNDICRYVRAMAARSSEGNVLSLYKLADGRVEVSEFRAVAGMDGLLGIPLRDLKLKKNILIGCLVRDGQAIVPHGVDEIKEGDFVLVVSREIILNELSDILEDR